MHRTIQIAVPEAASDELIAALMNDENVISLSVSRGESLKPPGDVITVHVLNRGADAVFKAVARAGEENPGAVCVVTAEVASIASPGQSDKIEDDVDEAVWEKMETGLRHQARITVNYLALMTLGGMIAAAGLASDPAPQAVAFVASGIIAPGFEPITKIPLGLVLTRWSVARRGAKSALICYACLIAGAAVSFALMRAFGAVTIADFARNPEVHSIASPTAREILVSVCGALAGVVIISAYRRSVIAGPLVALIIIPAAAQAGVGIAAGRWYLAWEGLERLGLDVLFIVLSGLAVFGLKQQIVHRRKPLA